LATPPWSDAAALAVVPVVGMEFSAAATNDQRRLTMMVEGADENLFITRIYIQHGDLAARPGHETEGIGVCELPFARKLGATGQAYLSVIRDSWLFDLIDDHYRKCSDVVGGVMRLPPRK
jgi:hypothetical protein